MYMREFDNMLQNGLVHAVILNGDNEYFISKYKKHYVDTLDIKESMLSMYNDEYDFQRAKEYLSQSSLFGDANFLYIRIDKRIPKKELDTLISYCTTDSNSYLMVVFDTDYKKISDITKSITPKKGSMAFVRLFESNQREALAILQQEAQRLGVDIDSYALTHLFTLLNNNLSLAVNELEKLSIFGRSISTKDIDMVVYSAIPPGMEDIFMDIYYKKPVTDAIEKLLETGEDATSILRALQRFTTNLYLYHIYIRLHGTHDAREITGVNLPKYISQKRAEIAIRIKLSQYLSIFEELLSAELKIKEPVGLNKDTILFGLLSKIQSFI